MISKSDTYLEMPIGGLIPPASIFNIKRKIYLYLNEIQINNPPPIKVMRFFIYNNDLILFDMTLTR